MEILLWLVPPVVVTFVAMAWVGWLGREGRGEVGQEEAVRRLGAALERTTDRSVTRRARPRRTERSTGVAVRRTAPRPAPQPTEGTPAADAPEEPRRTGGDQQRRAS